MKFQTALALLTLCCAAQAGKNMEVMTYGAGYQPMKEDGGFGGEEAYDNANLGSSSAEIVREGQEQAYEASDDYTRQSEAHADKAKFFEGLMEEKRRAQIEYRKRAQDLMAKANEAYKNSHLFKKSAQEKQSVAKELEHRAEEHDRQSKEQEMYEQDLRRKQSAERGEYVSCLKRANAAAANSQLYAGEAQAEYDITGVYENEAKDLYSKSEEYEKEAHELKDKSKKEKEAARAHEAKGKEEEARADEHEKTYNEASKRVSQYMYYSHEFKIKGESERHLTSLARIRAKYFEILSNLKKDEAQVLFSFANHERKDYELFKRKAIAARNQMEIMAKSASHVLHAGRFDAGTSFVKASHNKKFEI